MKITTQQELEKLIATADESNTIVLDENLEITFNCEIPRNIKAHNIKACNIDAYNIYAWDIEAHNITARNIEAHNITADNIEYHAFCIARQSLKCKSISGTRENSLHECLDQEIEIVKKRRKSNDRTNTKPIR